MVSFFLVLFFSLKSNLGRPYTPLGDNGFYVNNLVDNIPDLVARHSLIARQSKKTSIYSSCLAKRHTERLNSLLSTINVIVLVFYRPTKAVTL